MLGFVAQDIKKAMDETGYDIFSGWSENNDTQRVGNDAFVLPLVNAVKELSNENDKLKEENNLLKEKILNIISRLEVLENK